ncbi:DUF1223 domain-containing protein [Flavobacterium zepuense]|uniref:DUF1223 domain-containing protein n=2 Tax=Flavobacterium zepuense TaxID=2593302 RepID=A0A552V695_9FLAO|nr:DUF1223 domain-containing protein [Flavobacterium zepuense]
MGANYVTKQPLPASGQNGFAVVELFTSEGCSSCPPADELLGKIQQEYKDKPVYVLAYHVDYWDRMGWKDAYSSAAYTQRQSEYSHLLGSQLYTPQVIVNGEAEFVGSDERTLRETLVHVINGKASANLAITARQINGSLLINYTLTGNYKPAVLRLALVQKKAVRQIKRGENQGRTLTHWQIVRSLNTSTISANGKGKLQLPIPKDFIENEWEVIAMVQDPATAKIYAAAKATLVVNAKDAEQIKK